MADNAVNYIGEGLSRQGRGVNYANDIFKAGALRAKFGQQKQEKLIKLDDFSTAGSTLSPLFTKQLAQVGQDYANRFIELGGDERAARQLELEKPKYVERANNIRNTDKEVDAYVNANPKEYDNKFAQKINALRTNPNTSKQEWAALHNPDEGIIATPEFGFGAKLNPMVNFEEIVKKYNQNGVLDPTTAKRSVLPGGLQQITGTKTPSAQDIKSASEDILSTDYKLNKWLKEVAPAVQGIDQKVFSSNPQESVPAQHAAVYDWTKKMMTGDPFSHIDQIPKESEADKKVQNVQPETGGTITFTNPYRNPKTGEAIYKTPEGKSILKSEANKNSDANMNKDIPETVQSNIKTNKAYNFNTESLQVTPDHVINMSTGEIGKPSGSRVYEINQVVNIPVTKKDGKYIMVSDKIAKEFPKGVENKWYAVGLEKAGTVGGEEINKPRAIPLTAGIIEQLKNKKVNLLNLDFSEPTKSSGKTSKANDPLGIF